MTSNPEYAKGYAAGRRRAARDDVQMRETIQRAEFRRQVFLAILPELVRDPWQTGTKRWTTQNEFINGAVDFANAAASRFTFPQMPHREVDE